MPHEFVSALKLPLLDWRKVPEVAEEFAKQKSQKHETRQTLDSWRRERDSNHESGRPYLFETASKFSDLGSRDQFGCAIDELRTALRGPCRPGPKWEIASKNWLISATLEAGGQ